MDVVLVHPEIPHNTGCAARLTAATGHCLHLVEPLGFSLEDRYLKRAGLDYWPQVELVLHRDWEQAAGALASSSSRPLGERLRLFTARGGSSLFETAFESDEAAAAISAAKPCKNSRSNALALPWAIRTMRTAPCCSRSNMGYLRSPR